MGVNTRPTAHGQCWEGPLKRRWSGAAVWPAVSVAQPI